MKAFPIILSSPSGGGKTSIAKRILGTRDDTGYSVSCTTRPPRDGETDGVDYHFWDEAKFLEARKRGEFAEWAVVHDRLYGTLRSEVDSVLVSGRHVVLDIDVQGARQLVEAYPSAVTIFVLPPSAEVLVARLEGRGSESANGRLTRLSNALMELHEVPLYDYVVVNDELSEAVAEVDAIIRSESLRRTRIPDLDARIASLTRGIERELSGYSGSNNRQTKQ